jgi:K+-sensing histidine kinase KdpD
MMHHRQAPSSDARVDDIEQLRRDVLALQRRNEELAREAERRARVQEQLFATVAHDIRSQLAAITMVTSSLARDALPRHERKIVLLRRASKRIEGLADDLLDLARIEAGTLELPLGTESVEAIVEDVVATLRPIAAERGALVVSNVIEDFALSVDRRRITRAIEHLGMIVMRTAPRDWTVQIRTEVRDGAGWVVVEPDQSESATWREPEVGPLQPLNLGVATAKALIEAHGGVLVCRGARYEAKLPLLSEANATAPIVAGQEITASSS